MSRSVTKEPAVPSGRRWNRGITRFLIGGASLDSAFVSDLDISVVLALIRLGVTSSSRGDAGMRKGAPPVRCPSGCHGCAGFLGRAASLFYALAGLGPGPALLVMRGPDLVAGSGELVGVLDAQRASRRLTPV